MMRLLLSFLVLLLLNIEAFSTAQIPDLLIYNGDTLVLYTNPLEDYFNVKNKRPEQIIESSCISTACWRGYQAIWRIENNVLYLVTIRSCCSWEEYQFSNRKLDSLAKVIPLEIVNKIRIEERGVITAMSKVLNDFDIDSFLTKRLGKRDFKKYKSLIKKYTIIPTRTADLAELFKEKYIDGKVRADWYSGMLRVPKGKILNYVHMGYMSTFEYELTFEVENGNVIDSKEFSNAGKEQQLPEEYGMLIATSYSLAVPKSFMANKEFDYLLKDTIDNTTEDKMMAIIAMSRFNRKRLNPVARMERVEFTIDSLKTRFSSFKFETTSHDLSRWGTVAWVDGNDEVAKEYIRIYTITNINGQMFLFFRSKSSYESFYNTAQYITQTVRLMEFGY